MSQYVFHVRHNAKLNSLQAFLELVSEYPGADDETLIAYGAAQGSHIGTEIASAKVLHDHIARVLRDFSLLEETTNKCTEHGMKLRDLVHSKPELFPEVIHFFYYSMWNAAVPFCQVCVLDPEAFERVAGYVTLQFPFLAQGMGGGWGSFLRLDRAPTLDDLR